MASGIPRYAHRPGQIGSSRGEGDGAVFQVRLRKGSTVAVQIVEGILSHAANGKFQGDLLFSQRPRCERVATGFGGRAKNLPRFSVSVRVSVAQRARFIETRANDQGQVIAGLQELESALEHGGLQSEFGLFGRLPFLLGGDECRMSGAMFG